MARKSTKSAICKLDLVTSYARRSAVEEQRHLLSFAPFGCLSVACRFGRRFRFGVMALFLLLAPIFAPQLSAAASGDHYVFAHYMVCCSFDGHDATVDQLELEMRKAVRFGIDGFALNCGGWRNEPIYPEVSRKLFAAADRLDGTFKLFFSADASTGMAAEEAVDMVSRFRGHPSYLHVDGRPVLSTWHGSVTWSRAIRDELVRLGTPIYFVPNIASPTGFPITGFQVETPSRHTVDRVVADVQKQKFDGLFYFGAGGHYPDIVKSVQFFGEALNQSGLTFMAPVTPYYRGIGRNYRVFESDGFSGMEAQWRAAIDSGAQWIEIVTWNDWGRRRTSIHSKGQIGWTHFGKAIGVICWPMMGLWRLVVTILIGLRWGTLPILLTINYLFSIGFIRKMCKG